jgi:DNA-binding SARP family transcriptional activator
VRGAGAGYRRLWGELLPSCYDDWIVPERERLRQAFSETLERLTQLLESQDQPRAAIPYAQRLVRHDPLHEETYRARIDRWCPSDPLA